MCPSTSGAVIERFASHADSIRYIGSLIIVAWFDLALWHWDYPAFMYRLSLSLSFVPSLPSFPFFSRCFGRLSSVGLRGRSGVWATASSTHSTHSKPRAVGDRISSSHRDQRRTTMTLRGRIRIISLRSILRITGLWTADDGQRTPTFAFSFDLLATKRFFLFFLFLFLSLARTHLVAFPSCNLTSGSL